jgi:hypothetical protein
MAEPLSPTVVTSQQNLRTGHVSWCSTAPVGSRPVSVGLETMTGSFTELTMLLSGQTGHSMSSTLWAESTEVRADNLTDHDNYSLANNYTESLDFLRFYGSQPRKFVVRIRWLGKSQR